MRLETSMTKKERKRAENLQAVSSLFRLTPLMNNFVGLLGAIISD